MVNWYNRWRRAPEIRPILWKNHTLSGTHLVFKTLPLVAHNVPERMSKTGCLFTHPLFWGFSEALSLIFFDPVAERVRSMFYIGKGTSLNTLLHIWPLDKKNIIGMMLQ